MSVRIVTAADGSSRLSFAYGDGNEYLTKGQVLDVVPGSAAETAIGTSNLTLPTPQRLASGVAGSEGAISN